MTIDRPLGADNGTVSLAETHPKYAWRVVSSEHDTTRIEDPFGACELKFLFGLCFHQ